MYDYPEKEISSLDKYDEPRLHIERLMKVRLIEFNLSLRILILLEKAGIKTLGDLTSKTADELLKINQIGKTTIEKLKRFLTEYRLELKN